MTRHTLMPLFSGTAMGLMMLWLAHDRFMGDGDGNSAALVLFVGAHIAVLAVVLLVPVIASHRVRKVLGRLHRPSPRHMALMLTGAVGAAGFTYIIMHLGMI